MPHKRRSLVTRTLANVETSNVSGPVPFLNPTRARLASSSRLEEGHGQGAERVSSHHHYFQNKPLVEQIWRSRDNRKGRHAIRVAAELPPPTEMEVKLPAKTSSLRSTAKGLLRMVTRFPYWDVSYWVAVIFTWGSMIWVINAFFVWLPLEDPSSEFPNESLIGGGVTAFIGATVFEVGSVLLLLEAVNENQTACFGWAVETALKKIESGRDRPTIDVKPSVETCSHHHAARRTFLRPESPFVTGIEVHGDSKDRVFTWLPSLHELRTHYYRELGFQASLIQWVGATIFWIAGFTGLPGIIDHLSQRVENGVYWVPQIVGGMCFVISGFLFTIETQPKWYIPAPHILGWHIGMWNFIGGIGFTLCGALGPGATHSGVEYQATLATFWGSWAFLIGSTIQWYESLQKHPVEVAS